MVGAADETIQRIVSNDERPKRKRSAGGGGGHPLTGHGGGH